MTKYDSKILISQNFQKLKNSQKSKNRQNLKILTFYENKKSNIRNLLSWIGSPFIISSVFCISLFVWKRYLKWGDLERF